MTKDKLFEKYHIDESHGKWENHIDNWYSVEVYRAMHNGDLPDDRDMSTKYILEFLDRANEFFTKPGFGSMYLTAKRMV